MGVFARGWRGLVFVWVFARVGVGASLGRRDVIVPTPLALLACLRAHAFGVGVVGVFDAPPLRGCAGMGRQCWGGT